MHVCIHICTYILCISKNLLHASVHQSNTHGVRVSTWRWVVAYRYWPGWSYLYAWVQQIWWVLSIAWSIPERSGDATQAHYFIILTCITCINRYVLFYLYRVNRTECRSGRKPRTEVSKDQRGHLPLLKFSFRLELLLPTWQCPL